MDSLWETYDELFKKVREQEKRVAELERRIKSLQERLDTQIAEIIPIVRPEIDKAWPYK